MPWLPQVLACWYFPCVGQHSYNYNTTTTENDDDDDEKKVVLDSSFNTVTTVSSSSISTSHRNSTNNNNNNKNKIMVQNQRKPKFSRKSPNQLIKKVSPYEELPSTTNEMMSNVPFDEQRSPYDNNTPKHDMLLLDERQPKSETRTTTPSSSYCHGDIPPFILIPTMRSDDISEMSLGQDFDREERSLTPHPSFEEVPMMTAQDFHHLYQATRKLEEKLDWPSDEDGSWPGSGERYFLSSDDVPPVAKFGPKVTILKDIDHSAELKGRRRQKYRLV